MDKIILAIVGLPGSGKTEATKYIMKKTGLPKVYFGQVILDEVIKRYGKLTEDKEKLVREEMRQKYGMAAPAILNLPKIKEFYENSSVIIESLYCWEEYLEIKKEFGESFKVLAVYSSPATRQKRMVSRKERPLTPKEFVSRDYSQIENLHQAGPIARADFTIVNEGTLGEMQNNIDNLLTKNGFPPARE